MASFMMPQLARIPKLERGESPSPGSLPPKLCPIVVRSSEPPILVPQKSSSSSSLSSLSLLRAPDDDTDEDDGPPTLDKVETTLPGCGSVLPCTSAATPFPAFPTSTPSTSTSASVLTSSAFAKVLQSWQQRLSDAAIPSGSHPTSNLLNLFPSIAASVSCVQTPFVPLNLPHSTVSVPPSGSMASVNATPPSVSILIKETTNPLLQSLIAATKQITSVTPTPTNAPPRLSVDANCNANTSVAPTSSSKREELSDDCDVELPPSLERVPGLVRTASSVIEEDSDDDDDDDGPPQLESFLAPSDTNQKPPKLHKILPNKKRTQFAVKQGEMHDSPPPLLFCRDEARASSTSSGVSSLEEGDCVSPPSCSPLAPINENGTVFANRRSSRLQKENAAPPPVYRSTTTTASAPAPANGTNGSNNNSGKRKPVKSFLKEEPVPKRRKQQHQGRHGRVKQRFTGLSPEIKASNWIPIGQPWVEAIKLTHDTMPVPVACYPAVQHLRERITFSQFEAVCVSAFDNDPDNIGKIARIFRHPTIGTMHVSVLWYYRFDQCQLKEDHRDVKEIRPKDRCYTFHEQELIASRHADVISCDSIQSHVFVLTFNEYCRYMAENKFDLLPPALQARTKEMWPRGEENYSRRRFLPHDDTHADLVYFCRKFYSISRKSLHNVVPPRANKRLVRRRLTLPLNESTTSEELENLPQPFLTCTQRRAASS